MNDIKDRLHQMMLRSGFQSRIDQETIVLSVQEIERLRELLLESLRVVPDGGSAAIEYVGRVEAYFESAAPK